jgi:hypothetical protein
MIGLRQIFVPLLALAGMAVAAPLEKKPEPVVTYLGNQGPILCQ